MMDSHDVYAFIEDGLDILAMITVKSPPDPVFHSPDEMVAQYKLVAERAIAVA